MANYVCMYVFNEIREYMKEYEEKVKPTGEDQLIFYLEN